MRYHSPVKQTNLPDCRGSNNTAPCLRVRYVCARPNIGPGKVIRYVHTWPSPPISSSPSTAAAAAKASFLSSFLSHALPRFGQPITGSDTQTRRGRGAANLVGARQFAGPLQPAWGVRELGGGPAKTWQDGLPRQRRRRGERNSVEGWEFCQSA